MLKNINFCILYLKLSMIYNNILIEMQNINKIFFTLLVLLTTLIQANSVYDSLSITDNDRYFLKYNIVGEKYYEKIKNWDLKIHLDNNINTDFFCGKNWCFFSNSWKDKLLDSGIITFEEWSSIIKIPYTINLDSQLNKEILREYVWLDITDSLNIKTIQKRSLSCEISATADILSNMIWKKIDEDLLLSKLSKSYYNSFPINKKWKKYWWNPQEWFVGYIDKLPNWEIARQRHMTGYWVLEKPIEKIFNSYNFKTKIISLYDYTPEFSKKEHTTLILKELEKWNMVQLWWDICTNPKYFDWEENGCFYEWKPSWDDERKISWYYKDKNWKEVKYTWLNWEHAFYLLWYKWNINNPTHIIVWDTYTWKHNYVTKEWMRKWERMQYRSIIIYKNI